LIGVGLAEFRDFHLLCEAVRRATPVGVELDAQTTLAPEQQRAVDRAWVEECLRRDARHGRPPTAHARRRYAHVRAARVDRFTDEAQQAVLYHARTWSRFLHDQGVRQTHFYGLFVFPREATAPATADDVGYAIIADEPLHLRTFLVDPALVIPLADVIDYVDAVVARQW
jgi:hypothetical protein